MKKLYCASILLIVFCNTSCINLDLYYLEDFDKAMFTTFEDYYFELLNNNSYTSADMQMLKENYTKHVARIAKNKKPILYNETVTIPKVIHQIWLGSRPPEELKKLQKTWIDLHPDWDFKVWTEADLEAFDLINKESFKNAVNYGEKANIWRYEILYRFGGLYVDVDFECLKPFDLLHHWCDFYTGIHELKWISGHEKGDKLTCCNALIGSRPGHPILKALIDTMKDYVHEKDQFHRNGVFYFGDTVKKLLTSCDGVNVIFPQNYFYAWGKKNDGPYKWVQQETMAIHHFSGLWKKPMKKGHKKLRVSLK
ncbi:MAG: glycosyltransferase family 32 protein [Candidatus Babeliales bacterium]